MFGRGRYPVQQELIHAFKAGGMRKSFNAEVRDDIVRILGLWAEARARYGHGGPFLFGTFGAPDIFYAPIVSRFLTYGVPVPGFAQAYMQAVWEHDWMQQWVAAAEEEEWVIAQYEDPQPIA